MRWQGLPRSGRLAWAAQARQTTRFGRLCWILPHFPDPQKVHGSAPGKQQAMPWGGGQAAGEPLILPCAAKASAGKAEGLKLQLRGKHLRPGSLQLLLDWHQHLSSSSCLNSSCLYFQTVQAWKTNPGCEVHLAVIMGQGRGERSNHLSDETRASSLRWAPRKQLWSEEQPVSWAEKGTSQRVLFYSNTGWSGQGKSMKYTEAKTLCRYKKE